MVFFRKSKMENQNVHLGKIKNGKSKSPFRFFSNWLFLKIKNGKSKRPFGKIANWLFQKSKTESQKAHLGKIKNGKSKRPSRKKDQKREVKMPI